MSAAPAVKALCDLYEEIAKTVTSSALDSGGKKSPAKLEGKVQPKPAEKSEDESEAEEETEKSSGLYIAFATTKADRQLVTGIVLQPETVDAHGDIIGVDVIEKAAHNFLAAFNRETQLGLQHSSFKKNEDRFSLVESWIAPMDFVLGTTPVKTGSWIMTWKVHDKKVWKAVKDGKITGFSIGGMARAKPLMPKPA